MKKKYYEIYKAETGHKKTYLVAPILNGLGWFATSHFKCSPKYIQVVKGWTRGQYLWLEKPDGQAKEVFVAYYERKVK